MMVTQTHPQLKPGWFGKAKVKYLNKSWNEFNRSARRWERATRNASSGMAMPLSEISVALKATRAQQEAKKLRPPNLAKGAEVVVISIPEVIDATRTGLATALERDSKIFVARSDMDKLLGELTTIYLAFAALGAAPAAMAERTAENVFGLYAFVVGGITLVSACLAKMVYSALKFGRSNAFYNRMSGLLSELEKYAEVE